MPRYAVIDNGVVRGVLSASTPPTIDIPPGRSFVDITEQPDIKGGELYDGTMFSPAPTPPSDMMARLSKAEADIRLLQQARP